MKKTFGAALFIGIVTFAVSGLFAQSEIVVEESEIVVEDICSTSSVTDYVDKYLVRLEKTVLSVVPFGTDFNYKYIVTAKDKIKKVVVKDTIPPGSEYVSSSPIAQVNEDTVIWTLYNLEKGENVELELVLNATEIADFTNCATIEAYPEACTTTSVGVPILSIRKTTPSESFPLDTDVSWGLTIINNGNFCAKDVVINESYSSGLVDVDGNTSQMIEIGTLTPGESREINYDTKAIKPGQYCSLTVASGSNVESAEKEFCFNVLEKAIAITQKGPRMQFVGKEATYEIKVTNTGDIRLDDLTVTNVAPSGSQLLSAPDAKLKRNTATWMTSLEPGKSKSFEVGLTVTKGGNYCNEVSVNTLDSNLSSSAGACTEWRGYPALLIEVIDTQDPLIVGEETTYIIQVANQGTAPDTNVSLDIQIQEGLSIVSVTGETKSTVDGNKITFAPYPVLNAKEMIQFRVIAKAVETGDLRFKVKMGSDLLKSPVSEEESTHAY